MSGLTLRRSEPGHRAPGFVRLRRGKLVAIVEFRGPGRWVWVGRQFLRVMGQLLPSFLIVGCSGLAVLGILLGTRRYRWMQHHWIAFVFLLPFLAMLWLHHALDLSDALMVATPPGEREAHTFNLVMVIVFYAGMTAFVAHTSVLADRSRRWLFAKLAVLVGYWGSVLHFGF